MQNILLEKHPTTSSVSNEQTYLQVVGFLAVHKHGIRGFLSARTQHRYRHMKRIDCNLDILQRYYIKSA